MQGRLPRLRLLVAIAWTIAIATTAAPAQERQRSIRFWNLTLYTVTHFQLSPAGQDAWGTDQCANDRDGTVDHDERLRIVGITAGRYDARLTDKIGRTCVARNVEIKDGAVFSIEEKQLVDCRQ